MWGFFNDTLLDSYVLPDYRADEWAEEMPQYPDYTKVPYPKVRKSERPRFCY